MVFEQLGLSIAVGLAMGALIAFVAWLSTKDAWNNKLFAYTLIVGVFTSFIVIDAIEGGIDETNLLKVVIEIAGLSFFANKGIKAGALLQAKK